LKFKINFFKEEKIFKTCIIWLIRFQKTVPFVFNGLPFFAGAPKLMGDYLKGVQAEFSTLSLAVF